jgi:hypothetical protein
MRHAYPQNRQNCLRLALGLAINKRHQQGAQFPVVAQDGHDQLTMEGLVA